MYYVHYDNNGRPDMFSGFKSRSDKKAIEYCKSLKSKAYVSKCVKGKSPWNGRIVDVFEPPIYCNEVKK